MSRSPLLELPAQCADALTTDDMPRDPDEVLKKLWENLVRVMRRWVKTYQDAEDLAAQAVARVWSHLGARVPWREMWAWAVRVARRLLSNHRRDRGRERLKVCDLDSLASTAPSIDWRLLTEDTMAQLRLYLPCREAETLSLLEAGAESVGEVAAARGVSARAGRLSLQRLRAAAARLEE